MTKELFLYGNIKSKKVLEILKEISNFDKHETINLYINSYGGDYASALGLKNYILKNKNIVIINHGMVMSSAFFIFLAGEKRFCYKDSMFMYHDVGFYNGDGIGGSMTEINRTLKECENIYVKNEHNFILERTCITKQMLNNWKCKTNHGRYWNAQEALKDEIVHEILD